MAEATQYSLSLQDVLELIIKKAGVHEGMWSLALGMQIGVGNFGPTPDQKFPGATVTIQNLGIQKIEPDASATAPGAVVLDAAKVNPKKGK